MKLGLQLPNTGPLASSADLVGLARNAEDLGLETVWVADRLLNATSIRPASLRGVRPRTIDPRAWYSDALTVLAVVGGATGRIRLGTRVLLPALRHPVVLAKEIGTLSALVGAERIVLGVGAGWMEEEFEALGLRRADRFKLLDESLALIRQAWTQGVSEFSGNHYQHVESGFYPVPERPIPILIGGEVDGAFRRAARIGDGLVLRGLTPGENLRRDLGDFMERLRRACGEEGRDMDELSIVAGLPATAAPGDFEVVSELGVDHCAISFVDRTDLDMKRIGNLVRGIGQ